MNAQEIQQRLQALQRAAQEFIQSVNVLDMKFDTKETELRNLETKIAKLKSTFDENNAKASKILSDASEEAAQLKNEARRLMEDANIARSQAKKDQDDARAQIAEAKGILGQAIERQKSADAQWHILEQRKKKIEEAIR